MSTFWKCFSGSMVLVLCLVLFVKPAFAADYPPVKITDNTSAVNILESIAVYQKSMRVNGALNMLWLGGISAAYGIGMMQTPA